MKQHEKSFKSVYFYFLLIFLILGSLLAGTIIFMYHAEASDFIRLIKTEENFHLKLHEESLRGSFSNVISDLAFLKEQNELIDLINTGNIEKKTEIAAEYLLLAEKKGYYDQIRYLDEEGMEIVRINYNNGNPKNVRINKLQSKKSRYYFQDTIILQDDQFFISPLDLNIENGKIETPLKPMIRFAAPIRDKNGTKKGIVILNYLAENMLNELQTKTELSEGNNMVVNSDGYWLQCSSKENEWGFMIPERKNKNFSLIYPDEWGKITAKEEEQIQTKNGLFTSMTFYPASGYDLPRNLKESIKSNENYYWKLISHVSNEKLNSKFKSIMFYYFLLGVLLFLIAAFPAWLIAQLIIRGKLKRMRLFKSANYDKLTDLPNRANLLSSLKQIISESKRYNNEFALMYLDLDGFKEVNDSFGHDAGDQVLIQAAQRFKNSTRDSDIVSRIGGDEFVILIPYLKNRAAAERVAEKLIQSTKKPMEFKGNQFNIGVSIGISIYPDHGEEIEVLLKNGDSAMYEVKRHGKNSFRFFEEN